MKITEMAMSYAKVKRFSKKWNDKNTYTSKTFKDANSLVGKVRSITVHRNANHGL